jgi:hypothetical protein
VCVGFLIELAQDESNLVEEQRAFITLARMYLCKAEDAEEDEFNKGEYLKLAESFFRKAYRLIDESKYELVYRWLEWV